MSTTYEYVTLSEHFSINARRHVLRAVEHLCKGNADFARGSLDKAEKNFTRAAEIRLLERGQV